MTTGVIKVRSLATELAARVRHAQIVGRPIAAKQITALVAAARLLQDYGEPWPYVVGEALREFADGLDQTQAGKPENGRVAAGLSRFLGAFRREKSCPVEA